MDSEQHQQAVAELNQLVITNKSASGPAMDLIARFGYTDLRPDVAEYVEAILSAAALELRPSLVGASPDTQIRITSVAQAKGRGPFAFDIRSAEPPSQFQGGFFFTLNTTLASFGYSPTAQMPGNASYTRRYSPGGFIVLYVLLFPIGLLLLLARPVQTVSIAWADDGEGGTRAQVQGADHRLIPVFSAIPNAMRSM